MPAPVSGSPQFTPLQRVLRLLAQYRLQIRYIILYAVVIGLINLTLPLGVQAIIGLIAGGSIAASWGVLVLFILVGALLVGILKLAQMSIMEHLQRNLFADSAAEFALRIPRLHMELLRREHLPELVNRFFDTLTLQKGLPKLLIEGSTAALQIFFSLLLLSFYHPTFVFFSLLLLFILVLMFMWTGPRGLATSLKESKYKYNLAYWLEEVGRVATTFQLAGENRFPVQRADDLTVDYLNARAKHWRILVAQFISSIAFRVLVLGGFLILGSFLVMDNQLNIGQFVASEILVLFVIDSVEKLITLHETGYDVLTATEKLGQVTDLPIEREDGIRVEEFCRDKPLEVELRDLSYTYSDGQVPVLKDINLKIEAGVRLAVTGYNASGKSTLAMVLSVLKREFTGSLLFNGLPKQNLHLRSLRQNIGDFSSQEEIFKGSLLENITLGRPDATLNDVLRTCESVGLSEFLRQLPQGINTELLPGGKNIPRSIITKILVSRAIIKEPKMLVMEEPLSFLNLRDRLRIARLLVERSSPWTLVVFTQDPLLASLCDKLIVLSNGKIVFEGSFDELQKTEHYPRILRLNKSDQSWDVESQEPKS
jgi:ABC-type bacteriocin/lantibiotic exporter with double-glycine peptidase domain